MEVKKERSRNWFLLLYPDNPEHVKVLEKIPELDWEYVGILHDSDKLDDGSPAKPHNHVLLKFKDAVWNTAIEDSLGLELRFIQKSDNWKRSARYLVHKDHANKFQYDKTCLFGSMVEPAIQAINKSDPEEEAAKVAQIIRIIKEWVGIISPEDFIEAVCDKKLYSEFRRNPHSFWRLVDSHNRAVSYADMKKRYDSMERDRFERFMQHEKETNEHWVERCELGYMECRPMNEE